MRTKIQINERFSLEKDEHDNTWLYDEGKQERIMYVKNYLRLHKWLRDQISELDFNHAVSQLSSHEPIRIDDELKQQMINYFNPDLIKDDELLDDKPTIKLDPAKPYKFYAGDKTVYKQMDGKISKKYEKTEKSADGTENKKSYYVTVANFSIESIIRYKDIIGLSEKPIYTLTYHHGIDDEVKKIARATKEELLDELWGQDVFNVTKKDADKILRAIRHTLNDEGLMEKRETMFYRGYFIDKDHKLVSNTNIDNLVTSAEDLYDAVFMLIELLEFSGHSQYKHAAILRKTLHMPFHFCLKQLGLANDNTNGLKLHGKAGASKTGTVRIGNWFYLELPSETNDSVDTLAAMSRTMGTTTFPTLLDDAYTLFRIEHVQNVVKKGMYAMFGRTVAGKEADEVINYYAMSTPIITYNENIGITDEGLLRRLDDMNFGFDDVFLEEETKAFIKRFMPENENSPLRALAHIGAAFRDWIKPYIEMEASGLLDIEAMTIQFFEEVLERVGLEYAPLTTPYSFEEVLEDHGDIIRRQFNKELLRSRSINSSEGISEYDIETVARNGELNWLAFQPTKKNYVVKVNAFIVACNDITNQSWNFTDLMTELGIENYKIKSQVKVNGKNQKKSAIISLEDLATHVFGINELEGLTATDISPLDLEVIGEDR